jgi:hypothetical protein
MKQADAVSKKVESKKKIPASSGGGGGTDDVTLSDDLPIDEWMRRREKIDQRNH